MGKIFSQLISAQLENRTSDYSSGTRGRIWMRTDTSPVVAKFDDGSAIRTFVTTDNSQTLTNKTLTSPAVTGLTGTISSSTDIDLGTASNTSRITIAKNTLANLTALTRKEGTVWYATDTDKLYKDDGTSLTEIGSGSGGSINYVTNPDAESGTTGWAAYADAAATTPADGTGGSPTVTITRTTSSPLRGTGSFLITKDASNRQGEGVSYDFTIDSADKAKILNISFDYEIASGTFASGDSSDIRVWVYDVTNTVLIPVSPATIQGGGSLQWKYSGVFQTASNSTSYRLILHCATTSASAYTFEFDNVVVGPQIVNYGAPIGDFGAVSWTPTGSWSSNTTYTGAYRRVGDTFEGWVKIATSGAPTSATLTINLPVTIDTTKVSADTNDLTVGIVSINDSATTFYSGRVLYTTSTTVTIQSLDGSSNYVNVTQAAPITFGANDEIFIKMSFPVSGWSSTVAMSNDTDTRVVAASYYANTNFTSNTTTPSDFNTKVYDTHSAVTTGASWKFTAPVSGYFHVAFGISTSPTATGTIRPFVIYKNGAVAIYIASGDAATSSVISGSHTIQLNAGDYIDVRATSNTTYGGGTVGTNAASTISIERVSGPSAIAASETIAARYDLSASTANAAVAAGATEIIDFDTKAYDTHGAVTVGASWKFTAPAPGLYRVSSYSQLASFADGTTAVLDVYKNNAANTTIGRAYVSTGAANAGPSGAACIKLAVGDYIDVRLTNGDSSSRSFATTTGTNWVCVERIGI